MKPGTRILFSDEDAVALERDFSPNEIAAILRFKEYLSQLQELAEKTSNEKSRFTECEKEDGFLFNDQALIQLNKKYSSVQVKINEVLENKRHRSDQQFEQTQERINNLQKEVSSLKNSIETVPILQYQCASYLKSKVQTENTTQTSDESHSVKKKTSNPDFEVLNNDSQRLILTAIKDCMYKIVQESGSNWGDVVMEISKFLKENHLETKQQVETSISDCLEKNNSLQIPTCDSLIIQTENIEKELLNVFLILDRQVVDVQAIAETLRFFNRKFVYFAQKCDERWKDSCQDYIITCNTVQEAQENMNFSSCRMSRISYSLNQRSTELEGLMRELGIITQIVAAVTESEDQKSNGTDQIEETCASMEELENRICKIEDVFRCNTGRILEMIEKPGKKLESMLQYIEELGVLSDLVKNISKAHESMISCYSMNHNGNGTATRFSLFEESKDNESVSNISQMEGSLCQDMDNTEDLSCEDMSVTTLQNKVLEAIPHKRIITMLNNAIRKTTAKAMKENNISNQKAFKKKSATEPLQPESEVKDADIWGLTASDLTLSEVNSDCLLPKSGSSSSGED
ncbi:UNVERIFIED_CONTAM: hypothetical protein NCL1_48237 [Trichonephila clavipes]